MQSKSSRLYNWAIQKANSSKAPLWIALLFFLELVLFIPLDAILMFFCLQRRSFTILYVAIATVASLASGLIGYLLGHYLWDLISCYVVPHLISSSCFHHLSHHLQIHEHWAVFLGALLPLPLKALSLISGVFHLGTYSFAIYLCTARLLRFALVGGAMALWGDRLKQFMERHFNRIIMIIGAKFALILLSLWALTRF